MIYPARLDLAVHGGDAAGGRRPRGSTGGGGGEVAVEHEARGHRVRVDLTLGDCKSECTREGDDLLRGLARPENANLEIFVTRHQGAKWSF